MRRRSRLKKIYKKIYKKIFKSQTALIVSAAVTLSGGLTTFEYVTGLPASLRSDPIYNVLPTPEVHEAPSTEESRIPSVSDLLKDRLCERVVKRFAHDQTMWTRVNERILKSFGFRCEK